MTEQITLEQALELVDFDQGNSGTWHVTVIKGSCVTVKGSCGTVEGTCGSVERGCGAVKGYCGIVEGVCGTVEGDCGIVRGDCGNVGGNCHTVEGCVLGTINGRQWQYVETPRQRMARLIKEGASQEELLKALEEL